MNWPPPPPPDVALGPQPVIQRNYAGWGARFGATVIDGLIVAVPLVVGIIILAGAAADGADNASIGAGALVVSFLFYAVVLLYHPLTMMRPGEHNGQTFGKQALGIRVVRDTREPFGFWYSVLRETIAKGFIGTFTLGIDYLWPLWDGEKQALHDKMVSTYVVMA